MIRFAIPDDSGAIADIHVDTWRDAYKGIVPSEYLSSLSKPRRTEFWCREITANARSVLLEEDGSLVRGWIAFGKGRDSSDSQEGEVYALYVRFEHWRRGLGRALLQAAEQELWTKGFTRAVLWVLERNPRARAFYERSGYIPDGLSKEISFSEIQLTEMRYEKKIPAQTIQPIPGIGVAGLSGQTKNE